MDSKILVALAWGLPLAGKSTGIQNIIKHMSQKDELAGFRFLHLSVDLLELIIQRNIKYLMTFEDLSYHLSAVEEEKYEFDPKCYARAREEAFLILTEIIEKRKFMSMGSNNLFIFIDDNHLMKGVRKRYMKICRVNEIPYAELFFKVDIEKAISRSHHRVSKVISPEVIRKDFENAEFYVGPFTITIENEIDQSMLESLTETLHQSAIDFKSFNKSQMNEPEPKSSLSQIEELLRKNVSDFIYKQRYSNPGFKGQMLLSQLKKKFYLDLREIHDANPDSPELVPSRISSNFLIFISKNTPSG
jgi:hypothetical protein